MAIRSRDCIAKLPEPRRLAIQEEARQLIAEELALAELRKARRQSQIELAQKLGVQQAAISKMERRTDMYVSNLRAFIEAMGGELEIIARFPDQEPVRIDLFRSLGNVS